MLVKINETVPIRIKLPAKGVTLMLKPNCSGIPCLISVHHGKNFSNINQSLLFDFKSGLDDGLFKPFYSTSTEILHLNVSVHNQTYSHKKNHSSSLKFSLEVYATGCFYWERLENSWMSDGCKVSQHVLHFESTCKLCCNMNQRITFVRKHSKLHETCIQKFACFCRSIKHILPCAALMQLSLTHCTPPL